MTQEANLFEGLEPVWRADKWNERPAEPEVAKEDERGPIAPWMIPPLINIYRPGGPAYLWLRLIPYDDLKLEEYAQDSVGHRPGWLDDGISETGIEGVIQHGNWKPDTGSWFYWALTRGIGPGQPFCVELYPPRWCGGSYYEPDEWDCYWDWEVVRVIPRKDPARSWGEYVTRGQRIDERNTRAYRQAIKELTWKREHDHTALYLDWSRSEDRPHRLWKVELRTKHVRHHLGYQLPYAMAFGESETSQEAAFEDLVKRMQATELGKPRTVWDLIRQNPLKPHISASLLMSLRPPWQRPKTPTVPVNMCPHCKGTGFIDSRAIDCPHCDGGAVID